MATESFFIDLVLDTPEKYERYLAAMRNRRPIPDFDIDAAERGGRAYREHLKATGAR